MLIWSLLVAALGYAAWRVLAGYPQPAVRTAHLTRPESAFIATVSETLFPPGGAITPSGLEAGIPAYVDRYLGDVPPRMRFLIHCLFFLFEHATIVVRAPGAGGRRRFSSLGAEQRVEVLKAWRHAKSFPMRLVFTSLRAILTMGYFASPAVLRELRLAPYDIPRPVIEADLLFPPVGQPISAIRYNASALTARSTGRPIDLDGPLHPAYAEVPRT